MVDDDPSVRRILKRLFEAEGLAVDTYSDGEAGLDRFHADTPSAAILDLNLPKLSGRHLCLEMKTTWPLCFARVRCVRKIDYRLGGQVVGWTNPNAALRFGRMSALPHS